MTDVAAPLFIDDELLALATDEELDLYVRALQAEERSVGEWALQERQQVAEEMASGPVFELLYGGAAGGGKSEWLLYHMYRLAITYPGFKGLLLRRTFPELRRSLILRAYERFDTKGTSRLSGGVKCKYKATEHVWHFSNGSLIEFGFCESDSDVYQYQSAEYDCVGWDELTQFPTSTPYTYLMSRVRTRIELRVKGLRPHVIAGTNPGNVGGAWVKARFVDLGAPGVVHEVALEIDDQADRIVNRCFVPAKLKDNRYIDAGAYRLMLANLDSATRAALEDGSWDVVEGQFFTEWRREVHVIAPFVLPEWWERARAIDYGYAAPFCTLWGAWDGDGNVFIYRELYGPGYTPRVQANKILAASKHRGGRRELVRYTVADPSIFAHTGVGPPIAQQYIDEGLSVRKANNARIDGWARVHEYLRVDEKTEQPSLFIFSTCLNLIRTLPMLVHDKLHPEDLDTDGEDHAGDTLRYLLMSRPRRSTKPKTEPSTVEERMAANRRKRRLGRGTVMEDTPLGRVT